MKNLKLIAVLMMLAATAPFVNAQNRLVFSSTQHKFSIDVPLNWAVYENYDEDIVLLAQNMGGDEEDTYTETLSVVPETVTDATVNTLAAYYSAVLETLKTGLTNFKIIAQGSLKTAGGLDAKSIIYTYESEGSTLQVVQYVYFSNKTGYVLSGLAGPATFGNYSPLFEKIAKTFTLSK